MEAGEELAVSILVGLIQGTAEWLPVSSKTLILLVLLASGTGPSISYLISLAVNGATAAASIIYFRRELIGAISSIASPREYQSDLLLLKFIVLSTIMTALTAIPLAELSKRFLKIRGGYPMIFIGMLFLLTTVVTKLKARIGVSWRSWKDIDYKSAVVTGLIQGLSALPGISRSGVTIFILLLLGYNPRDSLRLSFLIGIPATVGGIVYASITAPTIIRANIPVLLVSSCVAAAISFPTISALLKASQKVKAYLFTLILAVMTISMGLVTLIQQPVS